MNSQNKLLEKFKEAKIMDTKKEGKVDFFKIVNRLSSRYIEYSEKTFSYLPLFCLTVEFLR